MDSYSFLTVFVLGDDGPSGDDIWQTACGSDQKDTKTWHGSLNVIGPINLIRNGTMRRCGFFGVGVALSEEVCHHGGGNGL